MLSTIGFWKMVCQIKIKMTNYTSHFKANAIFCEIFFFLVNIKVHEINKRKWMRCSWIFLLLLLFCFSSVTCSRKKENKKSICKSIAMEFYFAPFNHLSLSLWLACGKCCEHCWMLIYLPHAYILLQAFIRVFVLYIDFNDRIFSSIIAKSIKLSRITIAFRKVFTLAVR